MVGIKQGHASCKITFGSQILCKYVDGNFGSYVEDTFRFKQFLQGLVLTASVVLSTTSSINEDVLTVFHCHVIDNQSKLRTYSLDYVHL